MVEEKEPQSLEILETEDPEDELTERLLYGAQDGDEQEVKEALKAGADVDAKDYGGSTGVMMAVIHIHDGAW